MAFGEVFERFVRECAACVMRRALLENIFSPVGPSSSRRNEKNSDINDVNLNQKTYKADLQRAGWKA